MRNVALAFGLTAFLVACAEPTPTRFAFRPDTTNQQKVDNFLDCQVQAASAVPISTQLGTTPTYTTPITVSPTYTNCSGYGYGRTCTTTGGIVSGGQTYGGQTYSYDANSELRQNYTEQCMRKKGYSIVTLPTCRPDQIPEGMTASMGDKIINPTASSCIVSVGNNVGVPVTLSN